MRTLLLATALCLAGCAGLPQPDVVPPSEPLSERGHLDLPSAAPGTLYRFEAAELILKTYRGGWLGNLSHGHVMTSRQVQGEILLTAEREGSRAALAFRPWDLVLDDPEARRAAGPGFESTRTEADIAATRTRMLGPRGFDSNAHPLVKIEATWLTQTRAALEVHFRGERFQHEVDVTWEVNDEQLVASSSFRLNHADLGLKPYSAFAGAIAVANHIDVEVDLTARRAD